MLEAEKVVLTTSGVTNDKRVPKLLLILPSRYSNLSEKNKAMEGAKRRPSHLIGCWVKTGGQQHAA